MLGAYGPFVDALCAPQKGGSEVEGCFWADRCFMSMADVL